MCRQYIVSKLLNINKSTVKVTSVKLQQQAMDCVYSCLKLGDNRWLSIILLITYVHLCKTAGLICLEYAACEKIELPNV